MSENQRIVETETRAAIKIQRFFRRYRNFKKQQDQIVQHELKTILEELNTFYTTIPRNKKQQKAIHKIILGMEESFKVIMNMNSLNTNNVPVRNSEHTIILDMARKKHEHALNDAKLPWWKDL